MVFFLLYSFALFGCLRVCTPMYVVCICERVCFLLRATTLAVRDRQGQVNHAVNNVNRSTKGVIDLPLSEEELALPVAE